MRKEVIYCDICGEEFPNAHHVTRVGISPSKGHEFKMDVCYECIRKPLEDWYEGTENTKTKDCIGAALRAMP